MDPRIKSGGDDHWGTANASGFREFKPGPVNVNSGRRVARNRAEGAMGGWVYIVTNRPYGTLYVGVTADLARRAWEHCEGAVDGFSKRYGLKRLVYAERHDDIRAAIQRERNIKHWPRTWKVALVVRSNSAWDDLSQSMP